MKKILWIIILFSNCVFSQIVIKGKIEDKNGNTISKANILIYKKATEIGDSIAFILPISQLNNSDSLYEFDLIKSIDLGVLEYSGMKVHCCFNIYKRPVDGELNKRPNNKLKDVSIYRQDSKEYMNKDFDIRMCYWGDGTAGKILQSSEHYSAEYKIKIHTT